MRDVWVQKFIKSLENKIVSGVQEAFLDAKPTLVSRIKDDLQKEAFKSRDTMECISGFSFRISRTPLFKERIFICVEHILRYSTKDLSDVSHSYRLKAVVSGRDKPFGFSCHAEAFGDCLVDFVVSLIKELSGEIGGTGLDWGHLDLSGMLVEYELGIHQILK